MSRAEQDVEDDFDDLMALLDDEPEPWGTEAGEEDDDFDDLAEFDEEEEDDRPEAVLVVEGGVKVLKAEAPPSEPTTLGRERTNARASALIAVAATKDSEAIRRPLISGHCAFPQTRNPDESHQRCQKNGGGSRANPDKIFQPCPCLCHYPAEHYECGSCGGTILAAPHYPLDEDGDIHYVHLDPKRKRAIDGECPR